VVAADRNICFLIRFRSASWAMAPHLQNSHGDNDRHSNYNKDTGGHMAEKTTTDIAPRERQRVTRREPLSAANPFGMLERFADEIDSVFGDFGLGRNWLAPRWGRSGMPLRAGMDMWAPDVEVYQQNNDLVVRADLPGLKK